MTAALQQPSAITSRRALLAAALGGLGAWVASAMGRNDPVHADGENIQVGGEYGTAQSVTWLKNLTNHEDVFKAESTGNGQAVRAISNGGSAVFGSSQSGIGAQCLSASNYAVYGNSTSNIGVRGFSNSKSGVYGRTAGPAGVDVAGVFGIGDAATGARAVGVWGRSTNNPGVFGQSESSNGVSGVATTGNGVYGTSGTGWAGRFDGRVLTKGYHELQEVATPSAPAANRARLFLRDNGAGKTQLCVRFATGAVKVITTQA